MSWKHFLPLTQIVSATLNHNLFTFKNNSLKQNHCDCSVSVSATSTSNLLSLISAPSNLNQQVG